MLAKHQWTFALISGLTLAIAVLALLYCNSLDSKVRARVRKFTIEEHDIRKHNQIQPVYSNSEAKERALVEEEVGTVVGRIRDCSAVINLTISNDYIITVEQNVRRVVKWLRKTVPRFESKYDVPCWRANFEVTLESGVINTKVSPIPNDNRFWGSLDGKSFSHIDRLRSTTTMLHGVDWKSRPPHVDHSVVCLPKVFVLGYPKCGSTFLNCLIRAVISIIKVQNFCQATKEPHWWVSNNARTAVQPTTLGYLSLYLLNFQRGSEFVERNMPAMTIDSSPNLMFQWPRYSQNETMENYCLIPSLIPVILPDSKYFVVMRNPITMLYSAFLWSCTRLKQESIYQIKYQLPDIFHERIVNKISVFNKCKSRGTPLDICVDVLARNMFTPELPTCGRTRLEMGLYYFHTRKWLSVVPRERIHFFTLEELATKDLQHTAGVILNHLGLLFTEQQFKAFSKINCNQNPQKRIDYKHDPRLKMREDTRQILEEFFQPYNQMLADLLGDDKFLWM